MVRKSSRPAQRLVEDLVAGVVAGPGGHLAERPHREVELVQAEHGAVHEVGPVPLVTALGPDLRDRLHAGLGVVEAEVPQVHERRHRLQLDRQRQGVAQSPVGVGEPAEQVRVLVVRGGRHHLAVAGQDLHGQDGLVRHAEAQRGGLDAQAGDRAPQGDRLQLGHHERHQSVPQRRVRQVLIGGHAAHHGGAGLRVHVQHPAERGDVQLGDPGAGRLIAEPEQVGGALGQPHLRPGWHRRVGLLEAGHRGLVRLLQPGGQGAGGGGPGSRPLPPHADGINVHGATMITLRPGSATARVSHSASPRSGPARPR